jgi:hypothetical protein
LLAKKLFMSPWFSFFISVLALSVSAITAWLTFFRKGALKMTRPTTIAFLPPGANTEGRSQVLVRTLFYSSAKRGQIVESLHLTLRRGESKQNFSIWVYGAKEDLRRGSGLFVPQEGVTHDHYFLMPNDGSAFEFHAGEYIVTVFARLVGAHAPTELMTLGVSVSETQATTLRQPNIRIHFDWGAERQSYYGHLVSRK